MPPRFAHPGVKEESRRCLVCGKPLAAEEVCYRTKFNKRLVLICCPLCFEAFEKQPGLYLSDHNRARTSPIWRPRQE